MHADISTVASATSLVALFSLMWFVMGIVLGRIMPESAISMTQDETKGRKSNNRGGRQRQNRRNGNARGVELYVGNLPYNISKKEISQVFSKYGDVLSVRLIENRGNGRPKGFGFVEMTDDSTARAAIKGLHSTKVKGRAIVVSEAKSRSRA